jgi:hypothetical protein
MLVPRLTDLCRVFLDVAKVENVPITRESASHGNTHMVVMSVQAFSETLYSPLRRKSQLVK